jgi:hypothetical protein
VNCLKNTARKKFMKKYPSHSPTTDELKDAPWPDVLELPVEPGFVSRPLRVDMQTMLKRNEEHLAWRNSRPGEAERRLAEKISVEFVL